MDSIDSPSSTGLEETTQANIPQYVCHLNPLHCLVIGKRAVLQPYPLQLASHLITDQLLLTTFKVMVLCFYFFTSNILCSNTVFLISVYILLNFHAHLDSVIIFLKPLKILRTHYLHKLYILKKNILVQNML